MCFKAKRVLRTKYELKFGCAFKFQTTNLFLIPMWNFWFLLWKFCLFFIRVSQQPVSYLKYELTIFSRSQKRKQRFPSLIVFFFYFFYLIATKIDRKEIWNNWWIILIFLWALFRFWFWSHEYEINALTFQLLLKYNTSFLYYVLSRMIETRCGHA